MSAIEVYNRILSLPRPAPRAIDRHAPQKERTQAIRSLLREAKLSSVSVKSATGSMCLHTKLHVPDTGCEHESYELRRTCPACAYRLRAIESLRRYLGVAFPSLQDRSDLATDYHDFRVIVD